MAGYPVRAMTAAERYRELVEAVDAQRRELGLDALDSARWSSNAPFYRFDPRRPLDPNLARLAGFVRADDHVIDVGGGAGRIGLPLALRCRALTNVEPAPGMGEAFLELMREAGIGNAALAPEAWLDAEVEGDVAVSVDVVYFVREIEAFLRKLDRAAARRALIHVWSPTPPARNARLFEAAFGAEQACGPGHGELLAVLWDMGLLPEVLLLPEPFDWPERGPLPASADEAVAFALAEAEAEDAPGAEERVAARLDELFARDADGRWRPAWRPTLRGLLITWETAR